MKRLILLFVFLPAICLADPTATPEPTVTPTLTPTPIVSTMPISTYATVGRTSTLVLEPLTFARGCEITLTNDSDEVMYLNEIGEAAVMNSGYRLNANGGTRTITRESDDAMVLNRIYAICASGSKKLLVSVRYF
jgi:hypothetical protein